MQPKYASVNAFVSVFISSSTVGLEKLPKLPLLPPLRLCVLSPDLSRLYTQNLVYKFLKRAFKLINYG